MSATYVTKCKGCGCPLHSSTTTGVCSEFCAREVAEVEADPTTHALATARYLGADAALTEVATIIMSEGDANGTLTGDSQGDRFMTLTDWARISVGEWEDACGETMFPRYPINPDFPDEGTDISREHVSAWEEGWDLVWEIALRGHAHRTLGNVGEALALEGECEAYVASLRAAAGL